jgi:GIY-YIG catalytic domain-containing protein
VRLFDRKFGADFLAGVPREPGIYRMYDAAGGLLYVGKARNLRQRLAQYRTARRTKKDRKRRVLVRSADRIEWQACASELEASLTEIGLIQALRPRRNVAGAFPFLYPFIGIQVAGSRHPLLLDHLAGGVRRLRAPRRISLARGHARGVLRAHAPPPVRRASDGAARARSAQRAASFPPLHVPPPSA